MTNICTVVAVGLVYGGMSQCAPHIYDTFIGVASQPHDGEVLRRSFHSTDNCQPTKVWIALECGGWLLHIPILTICMVTRTRIDDNNNRAMTTLMQLPATCGAIMITTIRS